MQCGPYKNSPKICPRRVRAKVLFETDEIVLVQSGREIRICEDGEHARLVIWTELAEDGAAQNRTAAARASIVVNESQSFNHAIVLAVPLTCDAPIAGRSFEADELDARSLMAEIEDFRACLDIVEPMYQAEYARAASKQTRTNSSMNANESHLLRV